MTPAEIKDRLLKLGARREQEGVYTDQMICEAAVALIVALEGPQGGNDLAPRQYGALDQ